MFMQVFHWSRPCIRLYDSRVGCESRRIVENKATAAAVISRLRISNNGELKELEEGVKGKCQQLEKSLRPRLPLSCFHSWNPYSSNDKGDIGPF